MQDETEDIRRQLVAEINSNPQDRTALETSYTRVWTTPELTAEFTVRSFLAPFVIVTRKSDGVTGTLEFQHSPRMYYNFVPDRQDLS